MITTAQTGTAKRRLMGECEDSVSRLCVVGGPTFRGRENEMPVRLCPVCRTEAVVPLAQKVTVIAKIEGLEQKAGGVAGYRCEQGHVFFVRFSNLETFLKTITE